MPSTIFDSVHTVNQIHTNRITNSDAGQQHGQLIGSSHFVNTIVSDLWCYAI